MGVGLLVDVGAEETVRVLRAPLTQVLLGK
jgi:hypothetical protein